MEDSNLVMTVADRNSEMELEDFSNFFLNEKKLKP